MKRIVSIIVLLSVVSFSAFSQNKKEREALEKAKYDEAIIAIEAKNFVIIPDSYESGGEMVSISDVAVFLSCELTDIFLQGRIISGSSENYKMSIKSYEEKVDKRGNIVLNISVTGSKFDSTVQIKIRSGSNYADVIITTKGNVTKFSGELMPKAKSTYMKRSNFI